MCWWNCAWRCLYISFTGLTLGGALRQSSLSKNGRAKTKHFIRRFHKSVTRLKTRYLQFLSVTILPRKHQCAVTAC